jgi:uncharacterized protein with PQ loop repeat
VTVVDTLVLVANLLAVVMLLPQVVRLHRTRRAEGVSLTWAAMAVVTNLGWTTHVLWQGLHAAVWGCLAAVALYGVVALQLVRLGAARRPAAVPTAAWAVLLAAVAAADAAAGTAWLGILLALGFAVQVTPAVRRAWAEPAPTGISPTTWLLTLVSVALWGIYGAVNRDPGIIAFGVLGVPASVAVLLRWWLTRDARRAVTAHAVAPA